MKIAYFVSNRNTFPPEEGQIAASISVVSSLIDNLKQDHEITLYAAKGSKIDGVEIVDLDMPSFITDAALAQDDWVTKATMGMKQLYIGELFANADRYDLIHLHTEPIYLGMPFVKTCKTPVLFTVHNVFHEFEKELFSYYGNKTEMSCLSQSHAKSFLISPTPPYVYNGVEIEDFDFVENAGEYFLFLGRLTSEKGIEDYLELAKSCPDRMFKIAGKGGDKYVEMIKSAVLQHSNIEFLGYVQSSSGQFRELMSKAKALVNPIAWEEPFGLVMTEAMAYGTPVIAYNRGSVSEIVEDEKNGLIVSPKDQTGTGFKTGGSGVEGLIEAVNHISSMNGEEYRNMRMKARNTVEEKFTTSIMARNYIDLYEKVIDEFNAKRSK